MSDGAAELGRWLGGALRRVLALVAERGGGESSFLNVAVSDGRHVAVARFNSLVVLDRAAPPRVLPMGLDGTVDV